jgi:hypothetical protein
MCGQEEMTAGTRPSWGAGRSASKGKDSGKQGLGTPQLAEGEQRWLWQEWVECKLVYEYYCYNYGYSYRYGCSYTSYIYSPSYDEKLWN